MCRHCGVNFTRDEPIELDGWHVDPLMSIVCFRGEQHHFTPQETLYLHSILKAGSNGIRKEALFNRVSDDEDIEIKIVDVLVCKLRKKMSIIDPEYVYIKTMWGIGFAWFKEPCIRNVAFQEEPTPIPEIDVVVTKKKTSGTPRWAIRREARRLQRRRT
jgi:DNA-binding winged helix-turn-helix (wHTH) protein